MCEQREESTSKEDQPLSQVAKCVSCSSALLFYRMAVYYPRNKKVKGLSSCRQPVGVLRWWGVKTRVCTPCVPVGLLSASSAHAAACKQLHKSQSRLSTHSANSSSLFFLCFEVSVRTMCTA